MKKVYLPFAALISRDCRWPKPSIYLHVDAIEMCSGVANFRRPKSSFGPDGCSSSALEHDSISTFRLENTYELRDNSGLVDVATWTGVTWLIRLNKNEHPQKK